MGKVTHCEEPLADCRGALPSITADEGERENGAVVVEAMTSL